MSCSLKRPLTCVTVSPDGHLVPRQATHRTATALQIFKQFGLRARAARKQGGVQYSSSHWIAPILPVRATDAKPNRTGFMMKALPMKVLQRSGRDTLRIAHFVHWTSWRCWSISSATSAFICDAWYISLYLSTESPSLCTAAVISFAADCRTSRSSAVP